MSVRCVTEKTHGVPRFQVRKFHGYGKLLFDAAESGIISSAHLSATEMLRTACSVCLPAKKFVSSINSWRCEIISAYAGMEERI